MTRTSPLNRVHVIRSAKQLLALRTPVRQRVLNAIQELGPCSVAEVAERLEWKPESLYYHIKALGHAGLVRRVGSRPRGRRSGALYEAVASEVHLDGGNRTPKYRAAVMDAYRAALRVSERELERSLRTNGRSGTARPMVQQYAVRLSPAKAQRLAKMLAEVGRFVSDNEDPGGSEEVSLTLVLARSGRE